MPLTIRPPHPLSSESFSIDTSQSQVDTIGSPTSPDFSPITPKVDSLLPILDAHTTSPNDSTSEPHPPQQAPTEPEQVAQPAIPPTHYVPQPPPQPFSSPDSTDGLALKAAISSLQYQRQKAQADIRSLDQIRNLALADPESFARELATGRLKEKREEFGSLHDVADGQASEVASNSEQQQPDGQPRSASNIPNIPGPQNVVRMPHINWDKYHVVGEPLDSLHEQQRRWPGSLPFQQDRGREASVAAPYSPFQDLVDGQPQHPRNSSDTSKKDSLTSSSLVATPTTLEHPYETRRSSSKYHA